MFRLVPEHLTETEVKQLLFDEYAKFQNSL
jgi:hypothetical protein